MKNPECTVKLSQGGGGRARKNGRKLREICICPFKIDVYFLRRNEARNILGKGRRPLFPVLCFTGLTPFFTSCEFMSSSLESFMLSCWRFEEFLGFSLNLCFLHIESDFNFYTFQQNVRKILSHLLLSQCSGSFIFWGTFRELVCNFKLAIRISNAQKFVKRLLSRIIK